VGVRRGVLSVLVTAAVVVVGFGAGPSVQVAGASAVGDDRLQGLLANNPGAKVAGPDSVVMPNGVTLSLPKARKAGAAPDTLCPFESFCVYEHADFGGQYLIFGAECDLMPLWQYKMSNGRLWRDAVSSYINHQKAGTWAFLWDYWGAVDTAERNYMELVAGAKSGGQGKPVLVGIMPNSDVIDIVRPCPGPWKKTGRQDATYPFISAEVQ
jgi:hypothetical protein